MRYDVILRGGWVVDPANGVREIADVALKDGRVAAVGTVEGEADEAHDVAGKVVMPGIVDLHVHLSPWLGGAQGHRMLALAGVTTALDMAGPVEGVVDLAASHGAGLNIACIDYLRPGHTVPSDDPSAADLTDTLARAKTAGAIGVKLLGGHFPLTPEASAAAIAVANDDGAYVAFHVGTLATGSTIDGVAEACELTAGRKLHMAHINSYARGQVREAVVEGEEAMAHLRANPAIWSESYLAPFNGVSAKCADGVPESLATRRSLERGGFAPTEAGMADAIEAGWAMIHAEEDGAIVLRTGAEALALWRSRQTNIGASFISNPPEPRIRLVTATEPDGRYSVDCLATDGGGIPRNDIIARGLPLVRLDALTLDGFVTKASRAPAAALGLSHRKGHLGLGADGDVTVLDMAELKPAMSFAGGRLVMKDGAVVGSGSSMIVTAAGEPTCRAAGLSTIVVEEGTMLPPRGNATTPPS